MSSQSHRRVVPAVAVAALVSGLLLAGCGWIEDIGDGLDASKSKERHAETGAAGKESELLADWVPDEARDVYVMQRTTGSERLLTFEYAGEVPQGCVKSEVTGKPTEQELDLAYATDLRTRDRQVDEWSTEPTLEADWWPPGQEAQTTHLCGRWWVSSDDGTFYAFAAEFTGFGQE